VTICCMPTLIHRLFPTTKSIALARRGRKNIQLDTSLPLR
jgi:hypothetical protein